LLFRPIGATRLMVLSFAGAWRVLSPCSLSQWERVRVRDAENHWGIAGFVL
jgi:hypothetical protein